MQSAIGLLNLCLLTALLAGLGGLLMGYGLRGMRATRERESFEHDWRGRLDTSNRDLEMRAARLREVESKFAALQATSAAVDADFGKLKLRAAELEPLTAQVADRDRKLLLLDNDLRAARDAHETEIAALRHRLTETEGYRAQFMQAQSAAKATDDKLATAQRRIAELEPLSAEIAARDKRLAEIAPLRSQLADRDAEIETLRVRIGEIDKLAAQVRDWTAKHDALQAQFAGADGERDRLRRRVLELEPVAALVPSRDAELHKQRARIAELEASVGQIEQRDARIRDLDGEITRLKSRIAELDAVAGEAHILEQKLKATEDDFRAMRARIGAIEPYESEANRWRVRYGDLETQAHQGFRARDTEIERLRRLLQELRARPRETIEVVREVKLQPPELSAPRMRRAAAPKKPRVPKKVAVPRKPRRKPKDDLQLIYGVGPKLARFLNRRGIHYFRQVARWSSRDIARFEAELPEFKGRIKREGWVKSARTEHVKKYGRTP